MWLPHYGKGKGRLLGPNDSHSGLGAVMGAERMENAKRRIGSGNENCDAEGQH